MDPQSTNGVDTTSTDPHKWRKEIDQAFASVKQVFSKSMAPIKPYAYTPTNDDQTKMTGLLADLQKIGFKDVETLLAMLNDGIKGVQDDNNFLLENLVQLLAKLPERSKVGNQLTAGFINQLWNQLPHPPLDSLGSKYRYREADGSYNNIRIPDLGQAGTPYARTVKPEIMQNVALPDPGTIFDTLMARPEDKFEPHPNKISSMLFYLATIIIHDLFRTSHKDYNISMASSYLDLAPLYGSNQEEQDAIRSFKDGKLKPDCFSEKRILGFPPGVGVFLIMFNRFHNHVVTQLALINEDGRFTKPKDKLSIKFAREAWKKYDNDLFQVGRLITGGLYINIVLKDYVRVILNLNRSGSTWDLDPRADEVKTLFNDPAAEGAGNQCSVEFNLIYRWHSALSQKDDKWTQDKYAEMFPGKNAENVTLSELLATLQAFEDKLPEDPLKRPFANLKRGKDGTLNDDELVEVLESAISDVAGSFGANKVPKILRSVEILGIIQARSWNVASLNEFRSFIGLTKHTTFEDINPDPVVAEGLRNLYDNADCVELYPGLVAEKAKPPMNPGSGLCVNFTTSYSILSDAVALVRGDRFYTLDYTPKNLTNWGYNEVQFDTTIDEGQVIYKLILRAFPDHFQGNSIYAHYPFVIPEENLVILKSLGRADKYSWEKPKRVPELFIVKSFAACKKIIEDNANWKVTWGEAIEFLVSQPKKTYGAEFALSGDESVNFESRELISKSFYPENWESQVKSFYESNMSVLLKKYRYKVPGLPNTFQVDIVRDVANIINARFAASVFSLPIKTEDSLHGIYEKHELYQILALVFISIFMNADVAKSFQIRNAARTLIQQLGELVFLNAEAIAATGFVADIVAKLHQSTTLSSYGIHMIQRLLDSGKPVKDVVWTHLLPTAGALTANQAQLFSQSLDYYLGCGIKHIAHLYKLAHKNTAKADDKILRYFMEGCRLRHTVGVYRDYATKNTTNITLKDGKDVLSIPPDRRVFLNLVQASQDPIAFPFPTEVRLDRPMESYLHYGNGHHQCLGEAASKVAMTTMFKAIFGLKNLRRAPWSGYGENWGTIKKVPSPLGVNIYMTPDQSSYFPFPTTMKICWDED